MITPQRNVYRFEKSSIKRQAPVFSWHPGKSFSIVFAQKISRIALPIRCFLLYLYGAYLTDFPEALPPLLLKAMPLDIN